MLAIAPEAVRLELARPWVAKPWQPGPLNRDDPNQPNYAPDGVYGDPTLATREKGEALLEAMMTDLVLVLTSSLAPPPA
jgi:creatinine amidohydrolase